MKFVFATSNINKVNEIKAILSDSEILSLKDIGFNKEIVEDGETFEENALIKAKTVFQFLKEKGIEDCGVIADDSGLCVNALGGEPGIFSARYCGQDHDYKGNRDKLQQKLLGKKDRTAYFRCALVEILPNGEILSVVEDTQGRITKTEKGENNFGYDCIFYSNDLNKTFAEATTEEKNSVSHRGRALAKLLALHKSRTEVKNPETKEKA